MTACGQPDYQEYDELAGIDWQWQSLDGVTTKAPLGGGANGANPTDRGKWGTKRGELSDGRGIPLASAVEGANRHDMKLDHIMIERPTPSQEHPQHLCLDVGYDYEEIFEAARQRHYERHIRPNRYNRAHGELEFEPEKQEEPASNHLGSTTKPRASWSSACTPGSIALDASWCAGKSYHECMKPFFIWPVLSSAFNSVIAFALSRFSNKH